MVDLSYIYIYLIDIMETLTGLNWKLAIFIKKKEMKRGARDRLAHCSMVKYGDMV